MLRNIEALQLVLQAAPERREGADRLEQDESRLAGMLITALIGFVTRRDAPVVPSLMVAGVLILAR